MLGSSTPIADFHPLSAADAARLPPNATTQDSFDHLGFASLEPHLDYLSTEDRERVRLAYRFADSAHLGQKRRSGLPYITHPLAVATLCTRWHLDAEGLMAALLHDVMEDCAVEKKELTQQFGATVAELVDGLTKLDKLEFSTQEENQAENFRKMLVAMARDMRVILVKLADRTHNMRTLGDVSRTKWQRIARETHDIYLPLAQRLGLHALYRELQDLVFRFLYPWRFAVLEKAMHAVRKRRTEWLAQVQVHVQQTLSAAGLPGQVSSREKTLFSIYQKMRNKRLSFAQMGDIYGFRIIVPTATDCYTAMGVLHQMYRPVPGRFKDHIAIPKANSYQSLHTTLLGPAGLHIEFQFRTEAMHTIAESGVAAHWSYKQGLSEGQLLPAKQNVSWLQSLLDIQNETRDTTEFWEHIKIDLIPDAVYVFTPKGRILALPRGATVADFAYAIHTDVGDHMIAAQINGESVPLRTELRNGDSIEVITSPSAQPNPAWLNFVTTGRARSKIRHFLKSQELDSSRQLGEKLLRQALRAEGITHFPDSTDKVLWDKLLHFSGNRSVEDLLIDLGLGKRLPAIIAKRLVTLLMESGFQRDTLVLSQHYLSPVKDEHFERPSLMIDGNEPRSMVLYAACCLALPYEAITGYMGRGEGLQVHRQDCGVAKRLYDKDAERFIPVAWVPDINRLYTTRILVTTQSKQGSMARIANIIANCETDIAHIRSSNHEHFGDAITLDLTLTVRDLAQLQSTLKALQGDAMVISAERAIS